MRHVPAITYARPPVPLWRHLLGRALLLVALWSSAAALRLMRL